MSVMKHLPIQPYPGIHSAVGSDAHDHAGSGNATAKECSKGLKIRTSRHWVLPPRPKPGRKPNHSHDSSKKKKQAQSQTQSQVRTQAQTPVPEPVQAEKSNKGLLKKEIISIKLENNKLKVELGQLVDNLQDLKQKYNLARQKSHDNDLIKEKAKQKPKDKARPKKTTNTSMSASAGTKANPKKREYLDDSTFAFLKFEDESDEMRTESESVGLSPILISNAKMNCTSSISSCKTILTDDEDILTVSSSTPNSLFSSDLQHSSSISSASSINVTAASTTNHQLNNRASPGKNTVAASNDLRFLDSYEQMHFYDKYMCAEPVAQPVLEAEHQHQQHQPQQQQQSLHSIKKEDSDFPLMSLASNDNENVLSFLQQNNDSELPSFTSDPSKPCYNGLFFNSKPSYETDDLFQNISVPQDTDDTLMTTTTATTATTATTSFYVPPSLEELMEEQDGGTKFFSMINTTTTTATTIPANADDDDDALNLHNYDDDFDMLKVEVFDMVN